ncbi:hypothetical protein ABFY57_00795 [Paenibacillus polymyxa]|uniref:hypothetical protein n=1 Tax=Paenibacillus polymyxa TaxID=1406 RepID=UPI000F86C1DC|nr:hypothetical protein [Paenibacillus polymyxa]QDA30312.1 hypothetical protein FGY93_25710 [Paenibacillus polymyxa]RTZ29749.1 hypothetical protein EJ573_24760 [Paenibacillus polymyxa]
MEYADFITFCRTFQEYNAFDFEESEVIKVSKKPPVYTYNAIFRDNSNYKTNVVITLDARGITWQIADGWEDANEELSTIYDALCEARARA